MATFSRYPLSATIKPAIAGVGSSPSAMGPSATARIARGVGALLVAYALSYGFPVRASAQTARIASCGGGEMPSNTLIGCEVEIDTLTGARWTGTVRSLSGSSLLLRMRGSGTDTNVDLGLIRCLQIVPGSSCGRTPVGAIRIHGSNTIGAQLLPTIIEGYAASLGTQIRVVPGAHPEERTIVLHRGGQTADLEIELRSHGSDTAFTGLLTRKADLGQSSRPVRDGERDAVQQAGMGDLRAPGQEHVLALDGLPIIVHPQNPLQSLSTEQLRGIFTGAITDWREVGGAPGPIQVYSRDAKSGTFQTCVDLLHRRQPLAPLAKTFESSPELSDSVAQDPMGIGCVGFAYLRRTRALAIQQACGLTTPSSSFGVRSEEYPLSRRLYLYSPAPSLPAVNELLRFALSPSAWPMADTSGFVSLAPELAPPSYGELRRNSSLVSHGNTATHIDQGDAANRAAELRELFRHAQRLSITFRFENSQSRLDNRALADLQRLKDWAAPANVNRRIVLVGYSSAVGLWGLNVSLSHARANEVAKELRNRGARIERVLAAGPISAVACNYTATNDDDAHGQGLNRRVEVWVR